jgi:hypothetical protein
MEVALRRRLDGVTSVSISQSEERAAVTFDGTHAFSPAVFREALRAADVEVITLDVEACGAVEHTTDRTWLVAGPDRFHLQGVTQAPSSRVCVSGRLQENGSDKQIVVTASRAASPPR